ncbi:MAG: hypothetical protein ACLVJH_18240 [Faecalibacterium prausnitzii]
MLQSPTAQHLYHDLRCGYAHLRLPLPTSLPVEIYENRRFENIAQVWLGGRNPDGSYLPATTTSGA